MNEETFSVIAIFIVVFFIAYVVLSLIYIGIALGYELTPDQIADEQKTQFCIVYNVSNEECFEVYGDTESNWEPKK